MQAVEIAGQFEHQELEVETLKQALAQERGQNLEQKCVWVVVVVGGGG